MSPALALQNVYAGYGKTQVLEDISISVTSGEILAVIGPNGAGKTTLSKVMCRTLKPFSGQVEFAGKDVWEYRSREFARRVARVRQSERLSWPFTVEEIVKLGRFAHRGWLAPYTPEDFESIESALRVTGLGDLRQRAFDTLSGGEAQRTMVARAVAQDPELLVLDEPVSHLDIKHRMEVLDTARELSDQGRAVVVCLHDLTLAALYADRVALMRKGKLFNIGTAPEVLNAEDLEEVYGTPVEVTRFEGFDKLRITALPAWAHRIVKGAVPS
jgi:iron complex transport system ATP-binding protein